MTKEYLIVLLKKLAKIDDSDKAHRVADNVLLKYINDKQISKAYRAVFKWYS
jgi:hypothetical protein